MESRSQKYMILSQWERAALDMELEMDLATRIGVPKSRIESCCFLVGTCYQNLKLWSKAKTFFQRVLIDFEGSSLRKVEIMLSLGNVMDSDREV